MQTFVDEQLLLGLPVEVLHEVLVLLQVQISLLAVPQQEVLHERSHEVQLFIDETWLIDMVQGCRNHVEDPLNSIPHIMRLRVGIRQ